MTHYTALLTTADPFLLTEVLGLLAQERIDFRLHEDGATTHLQVPDHDLERALALIGRLRETDGGPTAALRPQKTR